MSRPNAPDVAELPSPEQRERRRRTQRIIRWVALLDLIVLATYLIALIANDETLARRTGFLLAVGFLALLLLSAIGATIGLWGWSYPVLVFITGGAVGALAGQWFIQQRVRRDSSAGSAGGFMVGGGGHDWFDGSDGGGDGGGGDGGGGFSV